MAQNDGNITVKALADVAMPGLGESTLIADSSNAYALTMVSNVAGTRTVMVFTFGSGLYKGLLNASTNPNYPAAVNAGEYYIISVSGKVGGASGKAVTAGDLLIANAANAGGTEAQVGTSWDVFQNVFDLPIATYAQAIAGSNNATTMTPLRVRQAIQEGGFSTSAMSAGVANTYTAAMTGGITNYTAGALFLLYSNNTNSGASTLNIDSKGALSIYKQGAVAGSYVALASGDIQLGYNYIVYDGIANGFVLVQRAGLNTQQENLVFVDAVYGVDSTARKYSVNAPYRTLEAAQAAAVSGDTISVKTGAYAPASLLGKNGVDWFFSVGATVTNNASYIFNDSGVAMSFNVHGYGNFVSAGFGVCKSTGNGSIVFNFSRVTVTGGAIAFDYTGSFGMGVNGQGLVALGSTGIKSRGSTGSVYNIGLFYGSQLCDIASNNPLNVVSDTLNVPNMYYDGTLVGSFCKVVSFTGTGSDIQVTINGKLQILINGLFTILEGWLTYNGDIYNDSTTALLCGVPTVASVGDITMNGNSVHKAQVVKTLLASSLNVTLNGDHLAYSAGGGGLSVIEMSAIATAVLTVNGRLKNNGTSAFAQGIEKVDGIGSGDFIVNVLPTTRIVLTAAAIASTALCYAAAIVSASFNSYPGCSTNSTVGGATQNIGIITEDAFVN